MLQAHDIFLDLRGSFDGGLSGLYTFAGGSAKEETGDVTDEGGDWGSANDEDSPTRL